MIVNVTTGQIEALTDVLLGNTLTTEERSDLRCLLFDAIAERNSLAMDELLDELNRVEDEIALQEEEEDEQFEALLDELDELDGDLLPVCDDPSCLYCAEVRDAVGPENTVEQSPLDEFAGEEVDLEALMAEIEEKLGKLAQGVKADDIVDITAARAAQIASEIKTSPAEDRQAVACIFLDIAGFVASIVPTVAPIITALGEKVDGLLSGSVYAIEFVEEERQLIDAVFADMHGIIVPQSPAEMQALLHQELDRLQVIVRAALAGDKAA